MERMRGALLSVADRRSTLTACVDAADGTFSTVIMAEEIAAASLEAIASVLVNVRPHPPPGECGTLLQRQPVNAVPCCRGSRGMRGC